MTRTRACGIVALALAGVCQAELMVPNMPRKSTEKPKEVPAAPMIKWEKQMISDNINEGIAVFDVNKDGKLDITAGPNWYEGPAFKPHPLREVVLSGGEFTTNNSEHGYDVNGDGWMDVIAASWFSDKIYWYENPGKNGLKQGKQWAEHLIVDGQNNCEGLLLEDLDGDKMPEIVVNRWSDDKPLSVIFMTPGKEPKFQKVELGAKGWGHGIAVGDINGDKRSDLIVAQGWFEQPAEKLWSLPWKFHKENCSVGHASLPGQVFDVNGDGRNDVMTGPGHDFGLFWFAQGPAENGVATWTKHEIDKSFSQLHCLVRADLDGDGKLEIITGKRWRGHGDNDPGSHQPMCVFRYIWDPAGPKFVRDTISFDDGVGTGMQIRVVDFDRDGKLDIAVAGKTGTYVLFNRGKAK